MWNKLWILLFAAICASSGCTRSARDAQDPKGRLQDYIDKSFNASSEADRGQMLSFLTGEAKERLSAWSDEQFRHAFVDTKRQFIKLVVTEAKPISPTEMNITYELSYLDQAKGKDAKVTNKKLCEMVKDNGQWLIRNVRNIKELIEYRDELSLP